MFINQASSAVIVNIGLYLDFTRTTLTSFNIAAALSIFVCHRSSTMSINYTHTHKENVVHTKWKHYDTSTSVYALTLYICAFVIKYISQELGNSSPDVRDTRPG